MNCQHAQRQFHDLADGRLPAAAADALRRHLAECTDCRVAEHRAARLERLLALKRHEQPAPAYLDNFLGEFHQRLAAANAPQPSWWDRLIHHLTIEPAHVWRYGLAGVVGVIVAGAITWWSLPAGTFPAAEIASTTANELTPTLLLASNATTLATQTVLPVIASAATSLPSSINAESSMLVSPGGVIIPAPANQSAPRYVLDRLAVTPVSYEASNIHF